MPAGVFSRAALALVLVSLPAQFSAGLVELAALRGVHPSSKALYGGETIQCDGGKTHPIGAFNDDFCDCSDGTDEPGAFRAFNFLPHFFFLNVLLVASQGPRRARTGASSAGTGATWLLPSSHRA